jgi:hypothetical protein
VALLDKVSGGEGVGIDGSRGESLRRGVSKEGVEGGGWDEPGRPCRTWGSASSPASRDHASASHGVGESTRRTLKISESSIHCSLVGSTPVGLWAQAWRTNTDLSGADYSRTISSRPPHSATGQDPP